MNTDDERARRRWARDLELCPSGLFIGWIAAFDRTATEAAGATTARPDPANLPARASDRAARVDRPPLQAARGDRTFDRAASAAGDRGASAAGDRAARAAGDRAARAARDRVTLVRARRELVRVHAIEQARLVRDAAMLAARRSLLGSLFLAEPRTIATAAAWRERAREEIALAILDGVECAPLARLLAQDPARWPAPTAIAAVALELDGGLEGRACALGAELAVGRIEEAWLGLESLVLPDAARLPPKLRAPLMEAVALAAQAADRASIALERYEAASCTPRSGLDPLLSMLAFAVRCEDAAAADRALARLSAVDLRIRGVQRRALAAVRRLRARLQWERAVGRTVVGRSATQLAERVASNASPLAAAVVDALRAS